MKPARGCLNNWDEEQTWLLKKLDLAHWNHRHLHKQTRIYSSYVCGHKLPFIISPSGASNASIRTLELRIVSWLFYHCVFKQNYTWNTVADKRNSTFLIVIGGTTEKASQFIVSLKSIFDENLCLKKQKCIFEHYWKVQAQTIFTFKTISYLKCSPCLFRGALYTLIFVLQKDPLVHFICLEGLKWWSHF